MGLGLNAQVSAVAHLALVPPVPPKHTPVTHSRDITRHLLSADEYRSQSRYSSSMSFGK